MYLTQPKYNAAHSVIEYFNQWLSRYLSVSESMNTANKDVTNLFRNFGGDVRNYQEIHKGYHVQKARDSWPIVAAMENNRAKSPRLKANMADSVLPRATVVTPDAVSATASRTEIGAFESMTPVAGIDLRSLAANVPEQLQPVRFGKDTPLSMVFSRLLGKKISATS
jgi:hypothetical protein